MAKFNFRQGLKLALALAAATFMVGIAPSARAATANSMILCISDTDFGCSGGAGNGVTLYYTAGGGLSTGTTGDGTIVSDGVVSSTGLEVTASLGVFNINIDSGLYMSSPGDAMDFSIQNTSTAGGTLYLVFGADNYTTGAPFSLNGSITSARNLTSVSDTACYEGGNGDYNACKNPANGETLVPAGAVLGSATASTTGPLSFTSTVKNSGVPFGLEEDVSAIFSGPGTLSADLSLVAAPEPTSILLFGGALVLACGAIRRKLYS